MKILTVVGRSESRDEFEQFIQNQIEEPFKIQGIVPLAQDQEAKSYLAYVESDPKVELELFQAENLAEKLKEKLLEVAVFDTPEEAMDFTRENYEEQAFSAFDPPINSNEIFLRDVLKGLFALDEVQLCRGLLDGKITGILVHVGVGHGDNDSVLRPLAILVDDDLNERLELPFKTVF